MQARLRCGGKRRLRNIKRMPMSKERIAKSKMLANDPDMISGIHNYCDKWCERCTFTSRCAVYAMGAEDESALAAKDVENGEFWSGMAEIFVDTLKMLREMAEEKGIDMSAESIDEYEQEQTRIDREVDSYPVMRAADKYREDVFQWFEGIGDSLEKKGKELEKRAFLDLPKSSPDEEAIDLNDALEVVQWYHTVISAKMGRAIHGIVRPLPAALEDMPRDSDGSAKVALICMDRSLQAWSRLLKHLPEQEDQILDFLVQLERMRRDTERIFPNARAFVRPGFDKQ